MTAATPFDPAAHLTTISGNPYLEVKWRIAWLRSVHPDASIKTEMVQETGALAIFRAEVRIPTGGSATGWGSETYEDFSDYIEKAESKALGRALAALGFGVQFCADFADMAGDDRRATRGNAKRRPATRTPLRQAAQAGAARAQGDVPPQDQGGPATESQLRALTNLAKNLGLDQAGLDARCEQELGVKMGGLGFEGAKVMIRDLQATRPANQT